MHNSNFTCSVENFKFINLRIHDHPESVFGSWKQTGGALIEEDMIGFNGYMSKTGKMLAKECMCKIKRMPHPFFGIIQSIIHITKASKCGQKEKERIFIFRNTT